MILRRGVVVEMGDTDKVLGNPQHPYSRKLVGGVPRLDLRWRELAELAPGDGTVVEQCPCHNGDGHTSVESSDGDPRLVEVEPGHFVGCYGLEGSCTQPVVAA